jgi:hypothetical protein
MNLTDKQLEEIQELAALLLEPEEIAVLTDIDLRGFLREIESKQGPVFHAYFKGKTETKRAIHENVIKMAKHGSPQAEELAKEFIFKQQLAEKRARK